MTHLKVTKFEKQRHLKYLGDITNLLHDAYKPLADKGMKYLASHQPPERTLVRLEKGVSFLGFIEDQVVSTITVVKNDPHEPCPWYQRPEVYFFMQFAVKPELQGSGIGQHLMDYAENYAREDGAHELAMDTSENATQLISMYKRRGYRLVEFADWSETNYKSVVLSKALKKDALSFRLANTNEGEFLTDLALRSKSHWGYSQNYLNGCRTALAIDGEYIKNWPIIVGEKHSKIVGFFALKEINGENRLDHLWLEPEEIGKGYGSVFFDECLYRAKILGWTSFRLAADPPAQGFYEKMGMTKIGDVQSRIKPDLFLPHMDLQF